jgi:hypothetical protein
MSEVPLSPPTGDRRRPLERSRDVVRAAVYEREIGASLERIWENAHDWAHDLRCPHLPGPLEACAVHDASIVCPWHGYTIDLRTGRSADGRGLRLRAAPWVVVDRASGRVALRGGGESPTA